MKKLSLVTALLLYISAAYPALDSWVQRSVGGKNLTIYIDAAINHVIKSSTTNIRSGLHWQNLTALDQTSAVKKNLQVGHITIKFNQYLVCTDSKTGVEIHHLALTNLDENHDCIIIDRATNSAWIKSFFGSKLTHASAVRTFINQVLRSGDIKVDNFDDQESTITIQYQGQQYRAVLRYKDTHSQQDPLPTTLITIYPVISCLGTIDRDNVPKNITEQLTASTPKSLTSSPISGKSTPTSRSANSSPKTPETTIDSPVSSLDKSMVSTFMSAAGKPDAQGKSQVNAALLMDLCQQDPDLVTSIDYEGNTALHYLAQTVDKAHALDIAWLFMAEEMVNQLNSQEQTPLTIALKNKNYELAQQILFAGGTSQALQAAKDAIQTENIDSLSILIDHIDIYTQIKQFTMLGYAVSVNNQQLIQFLLRHGADPRALRYKNGVSGAGIESCENSDPAEFVHKFPHTKQEKEKLIALLTDAQPVTKAEKIARWWQYLHEGKYLSAARLYEQSWSNQRSPVTNKTALEFACKRQAVPLVQQLLADGADTLAQTSNGPLHHWVKTVVSCNPTEKTFAIGQAIDQAFQQQSAAIDACIAKIQSQQTPDLAKFTSAQLQYISPAHRCSIAQALSIAHNHSVVQTLLTQHKVVLAPVLTYCLEHTTDWQHPASQQILTGLTTQAKEAQDKASFDTLTNFCMRQTDVDQVSALVQAIATAGANALELKLVEYFVTANPAIAQRLIAQLSDRGLTLSRQPRCAGNKMTLAELLIEKNNVQLMTSLAQRDQELNLDLLLMKVTDTPMAAVVREHKERRALKSMIDQAGHTQLTLAIVRGESSEKINEIFTALPELLNQPSSKAKIYPSIYALNHSPSCYMQLRQAGAQIPANAVEQACAIACSSTAIAELLTELDCPLPMDSSTASRLATIAAQEQLLHRTLAQKISDYIETHSSLGNMPEAYAQVIQSLWGNPEHVVAATKFALARIAQLKQDEQKVSYLCSIDRSGMIEVLSRIHDTQLIAQVIVQLTQQLKDKQEDTETNYTIYQLLDLLTLSELFTLTVKNQSLVTAIPAVIDKYLGAEAPVRAAKELSAIATAHQDTFVSQLACLSAEVDYTICQQLQIPQLTARVIARRLTTNNACTILQELITEEVAAVEVEKDGSTIAHVLMNYEDIHILLHYCLKLPKFFFKPNKKGIRPIDIALKKNKEQLICTILTNGSFNMQQLTARDNGRSLVEMRKESKVVTTYIAELAEQEFSQATSPLQRAVQLSPALIPDAIAYMEQHAIEPKLHDYLALHDAKQIEKFDELLEKHVQAGLPAALLVPLAKRVSLRDKKYMQKVYHQMMIELATSKAMNEQVFDMQKADPIVVETFPFCLADLDESTLMRELVGNVKYDASGKLLAEFINALEVVASLQTVVHKDKQGLIEKTDYVLQSIYNECQSYLIRNGITPSEETFVAQIRKIAQNDAIRFKVNAVTMSNRLVMINCIQPIFMDKAELLSSLDHRQIQEFWNKQIREEWLPVETHQATVMSFNALGMILFGLAPERFHADLQKLLGLRMDTSEQIRMFTTFATLYNTCKYIHSHPRAALQKFPDLEERFVDFCTKVLRNTTSYSSSRTLEQTTIQRLCDICMILIDLCPTYAEFILEQVAPTLEPYLAQARPFLGALKQPARHVELMIWAFEQHNLPAAKLLVTVSPIVTYDKNIYDLDAPWAATVKPEVLEKLQKIDRVSNKRNIFTLGNMFHCSRDVTPDASNFLTEFINYRDQLIMVTTNESNAVYDYLYFDDLEETSSYERNKIRIMLSVIAMMKRNYSALEFAANINTIYEKILTTAKEYKLYPDPALWDDFFIHRNAVPMLYVFLRTLHLKSDKNLKNILAGISLSLLEEQRRPSNVSDVMLGYDNIATLSAQEIGQYYFALAFDLTICAELFTADNTMGGKDLSDFCRSLALTLVVNSGDVVAFEQYRRVKMSAIAHEIIETIQAHRLYEHYFESAMSSITSGIQNPVELQSLERRIADQIRLIGK